MLPKINESWKRSMYLGFTDFLSTDFEIISCNVVFTEMKEDRIWTFLILLQTMYYFNISNNVKCSQREDLDPTQSIVLV